MAEKSTILIIDGDVIAFIAAAASERNVQDEYGNVTRMGFFDEASALASGLVAKFKTQLKADGVQVVLSDPVENWRYDVDRNYKGNRNHEDVPPVLLKPLKEYLVKEYGADWLPRCEADDYVGLLLTDPVLNENVNLIAVGRDKDFKCIPGWHFQIGKSVKDLPDKIEPFHITLEEADRWHFMQALAGDSTDGFYGCPGIGMKRAASIIDECALLVPTDGVITRGKNTGSPVIRWVKKPAETVWDCIVSNYQKAGLGEMEALQSAQCAHLLRHGEYNFETHEVKLWSPH